MTDLVLLEFAPPIATLTINRPEARNALSIDLLTALHEAVGRLATRADCSVALMAGSGKAFCAGMDLKAVLGDRATAFRLLESLADLTIRMRRLPQVTIARVNGAAIGGGCGLATVCDFAITHADAKLGFPEVDLGVCPAVVAPWLTRKVGAGTARRILLRGGVMSGTEAHQCGIVSQVVATREELDPAAAALAQRLAEGGPNALRATKDLLNRLDGSFDEAIVRRGAELSAEVLSTPESQATLRSKLGL